MKANYAQATFTKLKPSEQQALKELMESSCQKVVDQEEETLQEIWIKLACINLGSTFNFTEEQLNLFIGNWKRIYRTFKSKAKKDESEKFITEQMAIYLPSGFPQTFLDSMKEA